MPETKRKYDPIKRREYYLRTRELKGRRKDLTRYTKKGKGSDELRRDEEARQNIERELLVLAEKLKQEKAKGNQNSPAFRELADRYVNTLDNYRKAYQNAGKGVANQGVRVAETYGRAGTALRDHGENVVETYARAGRSAIDAGMFISDTLTFNRNRKKK